MSHEVHERRWRFPFEPLLRVSGLTASEFAHLHGVSGTTLAEYRTIGMTYRVADKLALKIGCHPAEVWGMDWWAACDADDEMIVEIRRARQRATQTERKRQQRARARDLVCA